MKQYYLAVDIGASSGRHILGWMENGKLYTEEVYRFQNGLIKKNGHLCWDFDRLFREIVAGMKHCKKIGKCPISLGIDTWGVDFVLLNEKDQVLGDTIGYRDHRTEGKDVKLYEVMPEKELYGRNGIQKAIFNSIYQLYAIKEEHPEYLAEAKTYLMTPEYFNFMLTGIKKAEYTMATTSQLINAKTNTWDYELMDILGYPKDIFMPISMPGTIVGTLKSELVEEIGYDLKVMLVGSHDTASAVVSVPSTEEEVLYISSGTWSLMGVERRTPDLSANSQERNFTNEGGYDYRFRYLKNIMGLWMIQSVRNELEAQYSFGELCNMAEENANFPSRINVNHASFLSPDNMTQAIDDYLKSTGQKLPDNVGQLSACIYQSLAECYAETVRELEEITGKIYSEIHIVGGGSNADYLNRLTAQKTHRKVFAGPTEATAIGNIAVQMIRDGVFENLFVARGCIYASFDVKKYEFV
ncbi:MAG: rhamnulokinase [Herbinix sp.]|nr:rhamnulokinase [Herbinix sp.]